MMNPYKNRLQFRQYLSCLACLCVAIVPLTGCDGIAIPVTLDLIQGVTVSPLQEVTGSADVILAPFCALFDEEDLDRRVREAAGDRIADLVTITSVELDTIHIVGTAGTFDPFTNATMNLTLLNASIEELLLGAATNNNGLDTSFDMTQDMPIDLLNDLEEGQCGITTLHLDGAGVAEAGQITFDVRVRVLVYIRIDF